MAFMQSNTILNTVPFFRINKNNIVYCPKIGLKFNNQKRSLFGSII